MCHTTHRKHEVKGWRIKTVETTLKPSNSLQADAYLARLMGELDKAEISRRLGQSRKTAGLTQEEMAELVGMTVRAVQDWESPKKPTVPYSRLEEWGRLTNVTTAWLLHGDKVVSSEDRLDQLEAQMGRAIELLEELLGVAHGESPGESAETG